MRNIRCMVLAMAIEIFPMINPIKGVA